MSRAQLWGSLVRFSASGCGGLAARRKGRRAGSPLQAEGLPHGIRP